jgi:4-hydroxy-2-oxoheptanedioate aldolase
VRGLTVGRKNGVKTIIEEGGTALGIVCRSLSPVVVELIGLSGFDFVWIDMEHTAADFQAVENLCRAADAAGIETMVRVPDKNESNILRALEAGASIINVPQVESRDEVEAVVRAARYHPLGERGFCSSSRGTMYGFGGDAKDSFAAANERTMTMVQIESTKGVSNAHEICSVKGLDIVFIGLADLSCSLGITGQFDHPDLISNAHKIMEAAEANGKVVAVLTDTLAGAGKWVGEGARIVSCGVDIPLIGRTFLKIREEFEPLKRQ